MGASETARAAAAADSESSAAARADPTPAETFARWASLHGIARLDATVLATYCVALAGEGRSRAHVRRQFSSIRRSFAAQNDPDVTLPADILELGRRLALGTDRPRVLVVSDDRIVRLGLDAALSASGVLSWSIVPTRLDPATCLGWDYVFVWLGYPRGLDPYGTIPIVEALGRSTTTRVPFVGVHATPASATVRLRMAEAGFRYAVARTWLDRTMDDIVHALTDAAIPIGFHVETPLALRERLGLALSGKLESLLTAALEVPAEVWTGYLPQSHLPISRNEVRRLRRIALDEAGLPAPAFSTYATSAFRRPPELPEWPRVRELIRAAFDISAPIDPVADK